MRKKLILICGLIILMALALVGCGKDDPGTNESTNQEPISGGNIVVAVPILPANLDSDSITPQLVNDMMNHVYEGLFETNANYEPVAHLAEGYEMSNDNKTYIVRIRQGVKFHNNKEMTSADVLASFDRWLNRNSNGQNLKTHLDNYSANGDYELQFTFKEPYAPFLATISANVANQKLVIRPKELVEKYMDDVMMEHIGTGPYEFKEFAPDQYVKLSRFENYTSLEEASSGLAGERIAYADEIQFQFAPEQAVRIAGVQNGQYHFAWEIPSDQYPVLSKDNNIQSYITSPNYQMFLILNQGGKSLKDIKTRQAIAYGLDMEQLAMLTVGDPEFWHLNGSLFPEASPWYDQDAGSGVYNIHDLAKAKASLDQSSYDGKPLVILNQKESFIYSQGAIALKDQLEKIGFNVDLQLLDSATVVEKRSQVDGWDIHINTFKAPDPDPQVYGSWMGTNKWIGNWDDEYSRQMDEIFANMIKETDQELRYAIVQQWYDKFYETIPYVKVVDYDGLYIASKNLQGYSNYTTPYYWNAWVK